MEGVFCRATHQNKKDYNGLELCVVDEKGKMSFKGRTKGELVTEKQRDELST